MNPFEGNTFENRAGAQRAVTDVFAPLVPAYRAGGARVVLGDTAPGYDQPTAHLESFARPLFGIVPFVADGGDVEHWDLFRVGLARGRRSHRRS